MNERRPSIPEFEVRGREDFPQRKGGRAPDRTVYMRLVDAMGDGCLRFPVADCDGRKRLAGRLRSAMNKLDMPVTISADVDGVWMRRREAGKKARKGKPRRDPSGDGGPKLTDDEVREVRRRRAGGDALAAIGRAAGVSSRTVRRILERKAYKHVPDLPGGVPAHHMSEDAGW